MGSRNVHRRLLFAVAFSLFILSHDKLTIFQNVAAHTPPSPTTPSYSSSSSPSSAPQGEDYDASELDSLYKKLLESLSPSSAPEGGDYDAHELDSLFKKMLDSLSPSSAPQGADDAQDLETLFKEMLDSLSPSASPQGDDYDAHELDSLLKEMLYSSPPSSSPQGADYDANELDSMFAKILDSLPPSSSPQGTAAEIDTKEVDSLFKELLFSPTPPSQGEEPAFDEAISLTAADADDNDISLSISSINFDNFKFSLPPSSAGKCDPVVKEICNSTDNPSLCLGTIVPFLKGKADYFSIFEISVKVSNEFAKHVLFMIKEIASAPGTPADAVAVLNDCKESYDSVMYNFENAMTAMASHDVGTINTMLSATMTDVGDCEDAFKGISFPCPITDLAEKLINMTSNSLAISAMVNNINI